MPSCYRIIFTVIANINGVGERKISVYELIKNKQFSNDDISETVTDISEMTTNLDSGIQVEYISSSFVDANKNFDHQTPLGVWRKISDSKTNVPQT